MNSIANISSHGSFPSDSGRGITNIRDGKRRFSYLEQRKSELNGGSLRIVSKLRK